MRQYLDLIQRDPSADMETVKLFTSKGHYWRGLLALAIIRSRGLLAGIVAGVVVAHRFF